MDVNILAVGDVCSQSGLDFLKRNLRALRRQYGVGFCVVNGENANGVGITPKQADLIFRAGADVRSSPIWKSTRISCGRRISPRSVRGADGTCTKRISGRSA